MFIALLGSIGIQAQQTWTAPTMNFKTFADGDTVFFYNVSTGMFLTEGNAYGTQASLGTTGTPFAPLKQTDGTYLMLNKGEVGNGTKTPTGWMKLFADNYTTYPGAAYFDENTQGHDHWIFYPKGDGTMEISLDTTLTADLGVTRFGWNGGKNTVVYPILDMANDTASKYGVVWKTIIYNDPSIALFTAKTALSKAMTAAQVAGVSIDTYLAIYNSETSTATQIAAAATELTAKVNSFGLNGASDDNPKDATSWITSADCSALTGWTTTTSSQKWQTQSNSECTTGTYKFTQPYIERWVAGPGKLADSKIYQKITGLPNGSYSLSVLVNATQQSTNKDDEKGTFVFAKSGTTADSVEVSTIGSQAEKANVNIVVTDGTLTIGFETVGTTCNWVGMDTWTLTYYGNGTGTLKSTLQTNINTATALTESGMNEEVMNQLSDAISNATSVYQTTGASADEITAQITALGTAVSNAKANIAAYAALKVAIDSANNVLNNFDPTIYSTSALSDFMLAGGYADSYETFALSTDNCNAATKAILAEVKKTIYSGIREGGDVTFIIKNPNFNTNSSGWSGTTPTFGYGCSEVYQNTFDTYQTFTDLPKGKYTLKVQAFMRTAGNVAAYTAFTDGTAKVNTMIYANNNTDTIMNLMKGAAATSVMNDSLGTATAYGTWPNDYQTTGGTFVPNSMQGASIYFAKGYYENTVSTVVTDGTLRIGIKMNDKSIYSSEYWNIFDNFRLTYDGQTMEALSPVRDQAVVDAQALYTKPMCADSLTALKNAANIAKAETDPTKLLDEIAAVTGCIKAANSSINTYATLTSYMAYSKQITDSLKRTSGAAAYATSYNEIEGKISIGSYQDSEIPAAIIAAKTATGKYLMSDITNASSTDPADVTFVIQNAEFAKNTSTGWTISTSDASYSGAANYQCFEIWNRSFNIAQTLYGMPEGTYKLTTQAYYRDGTNSGLVDSVANNKYGLNAKIYINNATGNVMPITDGAIDTTGTKCPTSGLYLFNSDSKLYQPNSMQTAAFWFDSLAVGHKYIANETYNFVTTEVGTDANGVITIGAKKTLKVNDDWTIFGGFKLYYLGNTSGIENTSANTSSVVSSKFFGINGTQNNKLMKGINIVKSTLSDGTVKVQKVLVK